MASIDEESGRKGGADTADSDDVASKIGESTNAAVAEIVAMFLRVPQTAGYFFLLPRRAVGLMSAAGEGEHRRLVRPYTFLVVSSVLFMVSMQLELQQREHDVSDEQDIFGVLQAIFESFSFTTLLLRALPILLSSAATAWIVASLSGGARRRTAEFMLYLFGVQAAVFFLLPIAVLALSALSVPLLGTDDPLFLLYPISILFFLVQVHRAVPLLEGGRSRASRIGFRALVTVAYFVPLPASAAAIVLVQALTSVGPPVPALHVVEVQSFAAEPDELSVEFVALIKNDSEDLFLVDPTTMLVGIFWSDRDLTCSSRDWGANRCWSLMYDPGYLFLLPDVTLLSRDVHEGFLAVAPGDPVLLTIAARGAADGIAHMAQSRSDVPPLTAVAESHRPWLSFRIDGRGETLDSLWAPAWETKERRPGWRAPLGEDRMIRY